MDSRSEIEVPFQDFSQRYRLIRKIKDPYSRDYNIVKDMRTQRRAIIKAYVVDSQQQEESILTNLNNYVELREVDGLAKFINFSRVEREMQAAFEFDDVTLEEFLKVVIDNIQGKSLEADKLYEVCMCMLNQLIEMLAVLQEIGMEIDDVRYSNILVESREGRHSFKLYYDEREKLPMKSTNGLFLSPERLEELAKDQPQLYDWEVKIIFELGLLLLTLLTEEVQASNYSDSYTLNESVLDARLETLNRNYPKRFLASAIDDMLRPAQQRATISGLRIACEKEFGNKMSFLMSRAEVEGDSNGDSRKEESLNSNTVSRQSIQQIIPAAQSTPAFVSRTSVGSTNIMQKSNLQLNDSRTSSKGNNNPQANSQMKTSHIAAAHPQVLESLEIMKERLAKLQTETRNYQDGSTYFGEMKNNMREGTGVYSYSHGDVYFGEWKDNALINGTYMFKNGESYQGSVRNGKHGHGKYRYANGNIYEGSWESDLKHGKGEMKYPNGDRYDGNWEKGKKNGYGIYYYSSGIVYEGNYVQGKKSGFGTIIFPNGTRFEGAWQDSSAQGFGKVLYDNGDVFEGEFRQSQKHGAGSYKWKDTSFYKGELKDDTLSGKCRIEYENGQVYEGSMIDGLKEGEGTYSYANKDVFIGVWRDDQKHMGRYIYHDGCVFQGEFKQNSISFGVMSYQNGDFYQGEFQNEQRHGFGKYQFADGTAFSGEWLHDNYARPER